MDNVVKTFIGCCLIHFCIGSIYAWSVLYPQVIQNTGWEVSTLITGFSITILFLGLTASLHQRLFKELRKVMVLYVATVVWFLSNVNIIGNFISGNNSEISYYFSSVTLGIALGLLYVIPINIITGFKTKSSKSSGLVVFCFGLGSVLAAKFFSNWDVFDTTALLPIFIYFWVMVVGIKLIQLGLDTNEYIESSKEFHRDKTWYIMAVIFFLNIGIGISLLSNLTQLSVDRGFTIESAVFLVSLAGLVNAVGRFIYPVLSDWKGKFNMFSIMLDIQALALLLIMISDFFWGLGTLIIISVYGGVFALMPSLLKQMYGNSAAYSQILSMWGFSGLICPLVFNQFGVISLCLMGSILLVSFCFVNYTKSK